MKKTAFILILSFFLSLFASCTPTATQSGGLLPDTTIDVSITPEPTPENTSVPSASPTPSERPTVKPSVKPTATPKPTPTPTPEATPDTSLAQMFAKAEVDISARRFNCVQASDENKTLRVATVGGTTEFTTQFGEFDRCLLHIDSESYILCERSEYVEECGTTVFTKACYRVDVDESQLLQMLNSEVGKLWEKAKGYSKENIFPQINMGDLRSFADPAQTVIINIALSSDGEHITELELTDRKQTFACSLGQRAALSSVNTDDYAEMDVLDTVDAVRNILRISN